MKDTEYRAWEAAGRLAVQSRDASLDGHLWYGVLSTGVYCRPSCPSPPAKPENLRFFRTVQAAEQSGFRPCKRCKPQTLNPWPDYLVDALGQLESLTVGQAAEAVGVSPAHLTRSFEQWLGFSPKQFQLFTRTERFVAARAQGQGVLDAALAAGFASDGPLYHAAKPFMNLSPRQLPHFTGPLAFSIAPCSLGWLLLVLSDKGAVFAGLGNTPGEVLRDCLVRFPQAQYGPATPESGQYLEQLTAFVDRAGAWPSLPVDVASSAFRLRVWQALRDLPAGSAVTYAALAAATNNPKAARAVGSACAANPVCLAVPCHRVVPAAGGTGQYFWQPWRKAWLLEMEKHG